MTYPFDVPLEQLRRRRSAKWATYAPDVLPLPVAEMDVELAPPVAAALRAALDASDTGYVGVAGPLQNAFAGFAARRWGWQVAPDGVRVFADVAVAVIEVLRRLVAPGDPVVLTSPVYPPFWLWLQEVGARPVDVPLVDPDGGGRLDLAGLERSLAEGARVVLLCSPHNPTGRVHDPGELAHLADLADRYGATVLADEIHAPLVLPGQDVAPWLTVSREAARTGIAFHSASKAWNLAGLKSSLVVTADARQRAVVDRVPPERTWGAGHLGVLAATAAYDDGEPWLDTLLAALTGNVALLRGLLEEQVPAVSFPDPQATYLAWLDCTRLGLGDDPAAAFLERGRVALSPGPAFGPSGTGHVRLNLACSEDVLRAAVSAMATTAAAAG